ncbi:hypothetical protein OG979_34655 [Actinomadura citrea]|uniref:hypothetical protein n=1 Tax=Actinomadura citrea TaxID=46158 RepID=UPI002E2AAAD2|nr:hypothetical protein [Actinomadura citrea]
MTFPDHIKSHTRTQVFCFSPDGLLRRHGFTIDIVGRTVEHALFRERMRPRVFRPKCL